jgi:hypothetical protein
VPEMLSARTRCLPRHPLTRSRRRDRWGRPAVSSMPAGALPGGHSPKVGMGAVGSRPNRISSAVGGPRDGRERDWSTSRGRRAAHPPRSTRRFRGRPRPGRPPRRPLAQQPRPAVRGGDPHGAMIEQVAGRTRDRVSEIRPALAQHMDGKETHGCGGRSPCTRHAGAGGTLSDPRCTAFGHAVQKPVVPGTHGEHSNDPARPSTGSGPGGTRSSSPTRREVRR